MISDKNYNKISDEVYKIDPIKVPDVNKQVKVGHNFTSGKREFVVIKAEGNSFSPTDNGMQAMAVAPIINGKVDTSQIVVAYAGTNQDDEHDIDTDIQTVIGGRTETLSTDKQILDAPWGDQKPVATTYTDSQLKTAKAFYDKVRKAYPQAQLTTTGHSLGGYLALVVAAENQVPATTFNGPDPIRGMSDKAVAWVKANDRLYNNYRIKGDLFGNFGAYYIDWFQSDELGISRPVPLNKPDGTILEHHSLNGYSFNQSGQVIDDTGRPVGTHFLTSGTYQAVVTSVSGMASFRMLKAKWEASGGSLSTEEALFLDAGQSYVLGTAMSEAAQGALDDLTALSQETNRAVESLWSEIDFTIYPHLSAEEVASIFASEGVTHEKIVGACQTYTGKKFKKMGTLATNFKTLKGQLDEAVASKLALDTQLAEEFGEYVSK